MSNEFKNGAFVFTRTRGLQPMPPDKLSQLAASLNIPGEIIPGYAGDGIAFRRSVERVNVSKRSRSEGYLLRPIVRNKDEVVYGIVREDCDKENRRLDHDHEAVVSWHTSQPHLVSGSHGIAEQVREMYTHLRGMIIGDDWAIAIRDWLLGECKAAKVRNDGRVYWVPPAGLAQAKSMAKMLDATGIDLILCDIAPEQVAVVTDVAASSLAEELDELEREAERFNGDQKPSTYERRLDMYQKLSDKAKAYQSSLGVGVDRVLKVLAELDQKVGNMLDLRRNRRVKNGGTTPTPSVPSLPASGTVSAPSISVPAPAPAPIPMPVPTPVIPKLPTSVPQMPKLPLIPSPSMPTPIPVPSTGTGENSEDTDTNGNDESLKPSMAGVVFTKVNGVEYEARDTSLLPIFDELYRRKLVGKTHKIGSGTACIVRRGPVVLLHLKPGSDVVAYKKELATLLGITS